MNKMIMAAVAAISMSYAVTANAGESIPVDGLYAGIGYDQLNIKTANVGDPFRTYGNAKVFAPVVKVGYENAVLDGITYGIEYRHTFASGSGQYANKMPSGAALTDSTSKLKSADTIAFKAGYYLTRDFRIGGEVSRTTMKIQQNHNNYIGGVFSTAMTDNIKLQGLGYGINADYQITQNVLLGAHYNRLLSDKDIKVNALGADLTWRF